jgi:hypothetical protein
MALILACVPTRTVEGTLPLSAASWQVAKSALVLFMADGFGWKQLAPMSMNSAIADRLLSAALS